MTNLKLKINDVLHARLSNGAIIHGQIDKVNIDSFLIDDDLSGDIMVVKYEEVEEVYFLG